MARPLTLGRRLGGLLMLAGLAACGAVPTKTFQIRAIDSERNDITCLVIVDDSWPSQDGEVHYTPATVKIPFRRDQVSIRVFPAKLGSDGKPVRIPKSNDRTEFRSERRVVEMRDPERQLFILSRDRR